VIWRKLDCLNPNLQKMQLSRPPERRLKRGAMPCIGNVCQLVQLRGVERCPARVFKEMNGTPTSRLIRTTGMNVGSPTGRES
jgi:hypothetical protein